MDVEFMQTGFKLSVVNPRLRSMSALTDSMTTSEKRLLFCFDVKLSFRLDSNRKNPQTLLLADSDKWPQIANLEPIAKNYYAIYLSQE